jgi:hypothetical protein
MVGFSKPHTIGFGEAIEQRNSNRKAELLAGNSVQQRLENAWEPWWLQTVKSVYQIREAPILIRIAVEGLQIDTPAEQPI